MGCDTAEAPDESRNFFSTRKVAKLNVSRIQKVGPMRNIPLDLQIIREEAQTSSNIQP